MTDPASGNPLESAVDRRFTELGKYYGIINRHSFQSLMLAPPPAGDVEVPTTTTLSDKLSTALLGISEGALTTESLLSALETLASGENVSDTAYKNEILKKLFVLQKESTSASRGSNSVISDSLITVPAGQGRVSASGEKYSFKKTAGISDGDLVRDVAILQVFGDAISPMNTNMGAISLFMNGVTTLEISRAVPFIDIVLVQQGPHFSAGRLSSLSMGQFLLGNVREEQAGGARSYLSANDSEVVAANSVDPEFTETTPGQNGQDPTTRSSPISTAGMELFTSPQTLVAGDEVHREIEEIDADTSAASDASLRAAPIIDRFRPLMSLKSLSLSVAASGGMMSYKSGKISLTVHDKSRLAEVAAFVRPARYGTTHMLIEYGWAHPESQPQIAARSTSQESSLMGAFIGSLRAKEKYQVVNSSFNFDDSGQVEVDMSIAMLGARVVDQVNIGLGAETSTAYQSIAEIIKLIGVIRSRLSERTVASLTGEGDVLGSLTSPEAVLGLDADSVKQLKKIIDATTSNRQEVPSLRELGGALRNLLGGSTVSGNNRVNLGGQISRFKQSIEQEIANKVSSLKSTQDPFYIETSQDETVLKHVFDANSNRARGTTSTSGYVSLGKIFSVFVCNPIAHSKQFDDTQVIFYNFNSKASYMSGRNIASFPVSISEFEKILKSAIEQVANMPIGSFVEFMNTYFLGDPGADAYGFQDLYKPDRSEEDNTQRQLKTKYRQNPNAPYVNLSEDSAALFNEEQRVLRRAYGQNAQGDLEFKMPVLQMQVETVPVRGAPNKTALRIHIFDSQASSHATLQSFLESKLDSRIGTLNAASQAVIASTQPAPSDPADRAAQPERLQPQEAKSRFHEQLQAAERAGLIEAWPPTSSEQRTGHEALTPNSSSKYRIKGGFSNLKRFIMRSMPSVRHGEGSSGILSAKVTSMSDPALANVNMLRQARSPDTPAASRTRGLPLQVAPVECNLETIGCPLWSFGQQLFIDFGTGTSVDAIYGVTGIEHTIAPGEFKSSLKLTPMSSYAKYESLFDQVESAYSAIRTIDEGDSEASE